MFSGNDLSCNASEIADCFPSSLKRLLAQNKRKTASMHRAGNLRGRDLRGSQLLVRELHQRTLVDLGQRLWPWGLAQTGSRSSKPIGQFGGQSHAKEWVHSGRAALRFVSHGRLQSCTGREVSNAGLVKDVRRGFHSGGPSFAKPLALQPAPDPGVVKMEQIDSELTPRAVVEQLDRFIVGQADAKRSVAIALRNRWRRHKIPAPLNQEIVPKNILMIGPTGCGKTEIARRLARLAYAPFVKVEATKFTEVGFHGRDVDQIIRDLVDNAVVLMKTRLREKLSAFSHLLMITMINEDQM